MEDNMKKTFNHIYQVILSLGTSASIFALASFPGIASLVKWIIAILGFVCLAFLLFYHLKSSQVNERICESEPEIHESMKELIKSQGNICIMSRDLSWVTPEIEECIILKADSIQIFAQKATELTHQSATPASTVATNAAPPAFLPAVARTTR